jgi:hypothetical protein
MRLGYLLVLLALVCGAAAAETPEPEDGRPGLIDRTWRRLTDEAYLRAGYGVVHWAMDIRRSSDGASARLVHRDDEAIFLSYGSKPRFIRHSSFGYTFMVNFVDFSMRRQTVAGEQFADVGTQVEGYLVYAVPTLYYQWGGRSDRRKFIRLGAGVGLGAARFGGTAMLSTGETIETEKHAFEPRLALSNFLEARWNYLDFSISYASPRLYGDGYDIKVSDLSASLGLVFYF